MVQIPDPNSDTDFDWDDEDPDLLNSADFDPFDDLDEEERDLIAEMMEEAAEREWLIPQTWFDDGGGDGTHDQADG